MSDRLPPLGPVRAGILLVALTPVLAAIGLARAADSPVPRTGQTTSHASGDDGDLGRGVPWPDPRFVDHGNGTVTDNLTGLIWLKDANCFGTATWTDALSHAGTLANGACGLSDGSAVGNWRLPSRRELYSLVDIENTSPALPTGHPFTGVQSGYHWSSSTYAYDTISAWSVNLGDGHVSAAFYNGYKRYSRQVWPVRDSQSEAEDTENQPTSEACTSDIPTPVIIFQGSEDYTSVGEEFTRYRISVSNWDQFPDELFAISPDLPPCGLNTNSSRTWIDIYGDQIRLYGFCALSSSSSLNDLLWFATKKNASPPSSVFVRLNDRRCDVSYTSNSISITP